MSKEQTALERIKDEVSREETGKDWDVMKCVNGAMTIERLWPIVCERFARECCQATLEKAAENASTTWDGHDQDCAYVDKSSITNKDNIVII